MATAECIGLVVRSAEAYAGTLEIHARTILRAHRGNGAVALQLQAEAAAIRAAVDEIVSA